MPKYPVKKSFADAYRRIMEDSKHFPSIVYALLDKPGHRCCVTHDNSYCLDRFLMGGWTLICRIQNGKEL